MTGVTNITVNNCSLTSTDPTFGGYGCFIGFDSYLFTLNSSAVIQNNYISSKSGHAVIIGSGNSTSRVSGNVIYGGYSSSAGQGVVLKNCSNIQIIGNIIYDGYNSGLYFKAATNCTAKYNTMQQQLVVVFDSGLILRITRSVLVIRLNTISVSSRLNRHFIGKVRQGMTAPIFAIVMSIILLTVVIRGVLFTVQAQQVKQ